MTKSFDLAKRLSALSTSSGEVQVVDQNNVATNWKISSVNGELLFYYYNGTTSVLKAKIKPDGVLQAVDVGTM